MSRGSNKGRDGSKGGSRNSSAKGRTGKKLSRKSSIAQKVSNALFKRDAESNMDLKHNDDDDEPMPDRVMHQSDQDGDDDGDEPMPDQKKEQKVEPKTQPTPEPKKEQKVEPKTEPKKEQKVEPQTVDAVVSLKDVLLRRRAAALRKTSQDVPFPFTKNDSLSLKNLPFSSNATPLGFKVMESFELPPCMSRTQSSLVAFDENLGQALGHEIFALPAWPASASVGSAAAPHAYYLVCNAKYRQSFEAYTRSIAQEQRVIYEEAKKRLPMYTWVAFGMHRGPGLLDAIDDELEKNKDRKCVLTSPSKDPSRAHAAWIFADLIKRPLMHIQMLMASEKPEQRSKELADGIAVLLDFLENKIVTRLPELTHSETVGLAGMYAWQPHISAYFNARQHLVNLASKQLGYTMAEAKALASGGILHFDAVLEIAGKMYSLVPKPKEQTEKQSQSPSLVLYRLLVAHCLIFKNYANDAKLSSGFFPVDSNADVLESYTANHAKYWEKYPDNEVYFDMVNMQAFASRGDGFQRMLRHTVIDFKAAYEVQTVVELEEQKIERQADAAEAGSRHATRHRGNPYDLEPSFDEENASDKEQDAESEVEPASDQESEPDSEPENKREVDTRRDDDDKDVDDLDDTKKAKATPVAAAEWVHSGIPEEDSEEKKNEKSKKEGEKKSKKEKKEKKSKKDKKKKSKKNTRKPKTKTKPKEKTSEQVNAQLRRIARQVFTDQNLRQENKDLKKLFKKQNSLSGKTNLGGMIMKRQPSFSRKQDQEELESEDDDDDDDSDDQNDSKSQSNIPTLGMTLQNSENRNVQEFFATYVSIRPKESFDSIFHRHMSRYVEKVRSVVVDDSVDFERSAQFRKSLVDFEVTPPVSYLDIAKTIDQISRDNYPKSIVIVPVYFVLTGPGNKNGVHVKHYHWTLLLVRQKNVAEFWNPTITGRVQRSEAMHLALRKAVEPLLKTNMIEHNWGFLDPRPYIDKTRHNDKTKSITYKLTVYACIWMTGYILAHHLKFPEPDSKRPVLNMSVFDRARDSDEIDATMLENLNVIHWIAKSKSLERSTFNFEYFVVFNGLCHTVLT